jgi:hypothetical protein
MKLQIEEVNDNVCKYCRKIMKKPDYPKTLELYRGEMLCLTVDVEGASKLQLLRTEGRYRPYRPFDLEEVEKVEHSTQGAI